jgi:hypothetical protein
MLLCTMSPNMQTLGDEAPQTEAIFPEMYTADLDY